MNTRLIPFLFFILTFFSCKNEEEKLKEPTYKEKSLSEKMNEAQNDFDELDEQFKSVLKQIKNNDLSKGNSLLTIPDTGDVYTVATYDSVYRFSNKKSMVKFLDSMKLVKESK